MTDQSSSFWRIYITYLVSNHQPLKVLFGYLPLDGQAIRIGVGRLNRQ